MSLIDSVKWLRRDIIKKRYLTKKRWDSEVWYFIMAHGIGDVYIVSSLLPAFMEQYGKAVLVLTKKNQAFIPALFSNEIEVLVEEKLPIRSFNESSDFVRGKPTLLNAQNLFRKKLLYTIGYKGLTITDTYKLMLGLGPDIQPVQPLFPNAIQPEVNAFFTKNNLPPGKTVLICPQVVSIADLTKVSNLFWATLAQQLHHTGLTPVFMNATQEGYQTVGFPLPLAKEICDTAGYVISLRSGFCDLVASSTAKKIILYPDVHYYSGKLIEGCSLVAMQLATNHNLLEYVLTNNEETDSKNIINFISE